LLPAIAAAHVSAGRTADRPDASLVATSYFSILNAGMKSGDFSAMATVFAPDATFTRSAPTGVTTVYHGIAAITRFYQSLAKQVPGYQWTTDSLRVLAPTVVLAYEHAGSPPLKAAGRCVHVFTIQAGKIVSYDWVVFFPGTM
jgi:hypothetical protein